MNWKLKAKTSRLLQLLPFRSALHYALQRWVTGEWPRRPEVLEALGIAARRIVEAANRQGIVNLAEAHFLEIGAGRDLATAVALRLLGVGRVTCVDVARMARPDLVAHAARHLARLAGKELRPLAAWPDIAKFGIQYRAPLDLRQPSTASGRYDVFYSVDTLEHIPEPDLKEVLIAARLLLGPGGRMIHLVDYGDHYGRGSGGLSRFNFLTYTSSAWRPFNSEFQFVNRLRHSQYLRLFAEAGLLVDEIEADVEPAESAILESLAPEFAHLEVDDLFTLRALIVAHARV